MKPEPQILIKDVKWHLARDIASLSFAVAKMAIHQQKVDLGEKIYQVHYAPMQKHLEALPEKFTKELTEISLFKPDPERPYSGPVQNLPIKRGRKTGRVEGVSHYSINCSKHTEWYDEAERLDDELNAIRQKRDDLMRKIEQQIEGYLFLSDLLKDWPEITPIVEKMNLDYGLPEPKKGDFKALNIVLNLHENLEERGA